MLLKLNNIHKSFPSGNPDLPRIVLDGVDLEVETGETVAILGPSGSGKSTLLNIVGTLERQDKGQVIFNGNDLSHWKEKQLTEFRNREIGFVFQLHHLLPQCTVLENVLIPTIPASKLSKQAANVARAEELIREVGLWEQKDQHPDVLSGGESQRVAVIRALINNPGILLADEPTGSLDSENAEAVIALLLKLNKEFKTAMIVVSHSEEIAGKMNRVYELRNGKLKAH